MSRVRLAVTQLDRPPVECIDCGRCCTCVGVGINPPPSPRHASDVLWYLKPRLSARIEKGFVPKALRPERKATAATARLARRLAVARKARI